jgi:hypothetical protein
MTRHKSRKAQARKARNKRLSNMRRNNQEPEKILWEERREHAVKAASRKHPLNYRWGRISRDD